MKNKVYVLGAGVNKILHFKSYSAPVNNDFFKILFGIDFDNSILTRCYDNDDCKLLREYIFDNWGKNKQELITDGLNLEELYTKIIQDHRIEADRKGNDDKLKTLEYVYTSINRLFLSVLTLFKLQLYRSDAFLKFGRLLYKEQPTIITFNYDNFVETSIEVASGEIKNPDPFGFKWNWNKALAYGIKFDKIVYDNKKRKNIKSVKEFYSNNNLYDWSILKLHGSVNWWTYIDHSPYPPLSSNQILFHKTYSDKKDMILLEDRDILCQWNFYTDDQLTINPIIVAPLVEKKFYSHNNKISEKFNILWSKAEEALKICDSLVIVGYSFPEADERTIKRFRNSLSNNKALKEILVVNPNKDVIERVKKLCPHKYVTQLKNLEEYLKNFPSM